MSGDAWKPDQVAKTLAATMEVLAASRVLIQRSADRIRESKRLITKAKTRPIVGAHDLMPLDLAVATVYRRVYERRSHVRDQARPTAQLDGLAYTFTELASIYVYEADGQSVRKLAKDDLRDGLFQGGGKVLAYLDGRPPIKNLAVHAKDMPRVISALAASITTSRPEVSSGDTPPAPKTAKAPRGSLGCRVS